MLSPLVIARLVNGNTVARVEPDDCAIAIQSRDGRCADICDVDALFAGGYGGPSEVEGAHRSRKPRGPDSRPRVRRNWRLPIEEGLTLAPSVLRINGMFC